ncbi:MAG: S9 family peptidase [Myxococcaceae bacterium]|nr:S9 family peptidase [Myxococcaceae bacterium]
MLALIAAVALAAAAPAAPKAEKPHAYTINDQVTMRRVLDWEPSPDGTKVAYTLRTTDLDANRGRTDLWVVNADGTGNRQLTTHPDGDTDPQWSADGKVLWFLSTRSGSSQVHKLSVEGGEAVQVTKLPLDVNAYELSRDGAWLAVGLDVFPDCTELECTTKRLDELKKKKSSGQLYDSLFVRHWDTWGDGRRTHLFVMPATGGDKATDVMKKMNADCPTKPFGGGEDFTWAPDGKSLVFSARDVGREEAWSTDFDLFQTAADGKSAPKKLTTANKAWDAAPVFSPDGKWLAYTAHSRPGYESDKMSLLVREWASGREKNLSTDGKWDHSAGSIAWSPDSKTIGVVAEDTGQSGLFLADVATAQFKTVYLKGSMGHARPLGQTGAWVASLDSLKRPVDLFVIADEGKTVKELTQVNAEALQLIKLGDYEQFSFAGAGGDKVYGYVVKPVDFDAKKKYPLAFLIHGGPQGSFGDHFHYRWNPQAYAGHGYVAVMIDFHGSTGYGQAFTDAIRQDWGGKPLEDLQKGLAAALEKYPFIDKGRMCALGASYGGFMVNWIAGNWNDQFKCLVNHDGNLDERFAYYDTEELWFPEWDHGGLPWEKPEGYTKHNPVEHVAKWKLPMLVVHGGKDYRVVDTQGIGTFNVLQRRGIPSKFLYFPDENHWVLKPANSILWHETVLAWLDQWTKK